MVKTYLYFNRTQTNFMTVIGYTYEEKEDKLLNFKEPPQSPIILIIKMQITKILIPVLSTNFHL